MEHASVKESIVIKIQKRFRFRKRWGAIMDYLKLRKEATIRIQKAFKWKRRHLFFINQIMHRIQMRRKA